MTRSITTNKVSYNGNGVTTVFAYTFPMIKAAYCVVIKRNASGVETTLNNGTDYTLVINTDINNKAVNGGTVTTAIAPSAGEVVLIKRVIAIAQDSDWQNGAAVDVNTFEDALDKVTDLIVQVQEQLDRALKFTETSSNSGKVFPEFVAGKALVIDPTGTKIVVSSDNYVDQLANVTAQAGIATTQANTATAARIAAQYSASAADASAGGADVSYSAAAEARDAAENSANSAWSSATSAATHAGTATSAATTATNAATSATGSAGSAVVSASNAMASATSAATSAATATTQAGIATGAAGSAGVSAANALTSEANAAASAAIASNAATGQMYNSVIDVSANTTLTNSNIGNLIRVDTSAGNVTVTLPSIAIAGEGWRVAIAKKSADNNVVNITRASTDTINGSTTYQIAQQWSAATLVADSQTTSWFAVGTGAGAGNKLVDRFTGTGSQTTFTLTNDPGSLNNTDVFIDGVYQNKNTYSISGMIATFSEAPPSGSIVEFAYGSVLSVGVPGDGTVGTSKIADGSVTLAKLSGLVDVDGNLAANSDSKIASQKAVKTFVNASVSGATNRLDVAEADLGLLFLSIARLDSPTSPNVGGTQVSDEFDDATGVLSNTGSVTGGYATNCPAPIQPAFVSMAAVGAVNYIANYNTPMTNNAVVNGLGAASNVSMSVTPKIVKKNSSGNYDIVQSYTPQTHAGGGWQWFDISPFTVPATGTYYVGFYLSSNVTIGVLNASDAYKTGADAGVATGVAFTEEVGTRTAALGARYQAVPTTTISNSYTATTSPTTVTVVAEYHDVATTSVLNTDIIIDVSRDNGTSWTAVNVSDFGPAPISGARVVKGSVSVAGQPTGTSMKWRVRTFNNKEQRVHGIWMQWN